MPDSGEHVNEPSGCIKAGASYLAEPLSASLECLCSMELVSCSDIGPNTNLTRRTNVTLAFFFKECLCKNVM
jgi:hypothetical protein